MIPWESDSSSAVCRRCNQPWSSLFKWKHHCRKCGQLVCSECIYDGSYFLFVGEEKICLPCKALDTAIAAAEYDVASPNQHIQKEKINISSPYSSLKEIAKQALSGSHRKNKMTMDSNSNKRSNSIDADEHQYHQQYVNHDIQTEFLEYVQFPVDSSCDHHKGKSEKLETSVSHSSRARRKLDLPMKTSIGGLLSPNQVHSCTLSKQTPILIKDFGDSPSPNSVNAESRSHRRRRRKSGTSPNTRKFSFRGTAEVSPLVFLSSFSQNSYSASAAVGVVADEDLLVFEGLTPKARYVLMVVDSLCDQDMERLFRKLGALINNQKKWYTAEEPWRFLHEILLREDDFFLEDGSLSLYM